MPLPGDTPSAVPMTALPARMRLICNKCASEVLGVTLCGGLHNGPGTFARIIHAVTAGNLVGHMSGNHRDDGDVRIQRN